jgi:hypothetical protein
MRIPDEIQDAFYAGNRSEIVKFVINDAVEVVTGDHAGKLCAVISIQQLEPEVVYLVEHGKDGSSIIVPQSALRLIEGEE